MTLLAKVTRKVALIWVVTKTNRYKHYHITIHNFTSKLMRRYPQLVLYVVIPNQLPYPRLQFDSAFCHSSWLTLLINVQKKIWKNGV